VQLPNDWRVECKARAEGWRTLYAYLEGANVLALRADRRPWLAVLPLDRLAAPLEAAGVVPIVEEVAAGGRR
jgi:hypothetical protein